MDSLALYFGLWSLHAQEAENETHNMVGIQIERLFVGHFKNSYGKDAWTVGLGLTSLEISDSFRVNFAAGFASGYKDASKAASKDVIPYFVPALEYDLTPNLSAELGISPAVVGLSFKWRFQ